MKELFLFCVCEPVKINNESEGLMQLMKRGLAQEKITTLQGVCTKFQKGVAPTLVESLLMEHLNILAPFLILIY